MCFPNNYLLLSVAYIFLLVSYKAACPKNIHLVVSARKQIRLDKQTLPTIWECLAVIKSPSIIIFKVVKWKLNYPTQVSGTEYWSPHMQSDLMAKVDSKTVSDVLRLHRAVFHIALTGQLSNSMHIYLGLLDIWKPIQLSLYSCFCPIKSV